MIKARIAQEHPLLLFNQPLVRTFWNESVVPYAAVWDEYVWEHDGLKMQLERGRLRARGSRQFASCL
ncbi:MAG: hypothetical protein GEV06_10150 [Luteitalea sp.]|nr:hypothetical protein [Luteitalea sp.]